MAGDENRMHPEVINFHEVSVEAITLTQEDVLTRKDLQWLRADARAVLTAAQRRLDEMEARDDAR